MNLSEIRSRSSFRPGLFSGRIALVTGGGSGIGRCIAAELIALGATVVIAGRKLERLERASAEFQHAITQDGTGFAGSVRHVKMDIRDRDEVDSVIKNVVAEHGALDYVVNNAGGQFPSPAAAISAKGWRAVVDTNLNGMFWVSQSAFTHAVPVNKHGLSIITIVADMWNGFPGMAHTGAARAAVVNLTKTLAIEWGPSRVRVNAVAPGVIISNGVNNYDPNFQSSFVQWATQNPVGRGGTESEVSAAVSFLLSPAAAYITGTTLCVDGASSLAKANGILTRLPDRPTTEAYHLSQGFEDYYNGLTQTHLKSKL